MRGKSTQIFTMIKYWKKVLSVSVILIDSVYGTGKNYYQVFLEEYKYPVNEKKVPEYLTDNIKISSDDSDEEKSDEETSHEENSNEEN